MRACQLERGDATPLARLGIVALDGGEVVGAVRAGDGEQFAVGDDRVEAAALALHRRQERPHVGDGVVLLDGAETFSTIVSTFNSRE